MSSLDGDGCESTSRSSSVLTVSYDDPETCRPALPRIKSCLKISPSHSGTSTPLPDSLVKKHVAFCAQGTEEVHEADEWDRTPAEVTQRLTYEDVLELKMIQRELPRAPQPSDPSSSKPFANVFLSQVPIPLLPLSTARPPESEPIRPHNIPVPPPPVPPRPSPPPACPQAQIKSNLPPPKRTFTFLPLLDASSHDGSTTCTSPPSHSDEQPTPTIHAISPLSIAVSDSDRDLGYVSDCSVTESSTPSLTTASLASSSPPGSPGLENRLLFHDGEYDDLVLNLDLDADIDPNSDSLMAQHDGRSKLALGCSTPPAAGVGAGAGVGTGAGVGVGVASPGPVTRSVPSICEAVRTITTVAASDPLYKLRLRAVPSPDSVPSPLELPDSMRSLVDTKRRPSAQQALTLEGGDGRLEGGKKSRHLLLNGDGLSSPHSFSGM